MSVVGLDIGTNVVKIVQVKEAGDKFQLINLAISEISSEPVEELEPQARFNLTVEAIKKVVKESGIKSKNVALSLSGDGVIVRYVRLPFMSRDELKAIVKHEAEQYIPIGIDQVMLDFQILGEVSEDNQKKMDVLLVAAKNELVDQYINIVQSAGLIPLLIDVDVFALGNSYEANFGKKEGETVALVNIGAKIISINILEDGVTKFGRDVAAGSNIITKDIQREFKLNYIDAEKFKKEEATVIIESDDELLLTRIPDKEDKSMKTHEAIIGNLNKMVAEIRRALDFYESQAKKRVVNKVLLSGGGSLLKNMDKFLNDKLRIPVEFNNPLANFEVKLDNFPADKISGLASQLAVVIGLSTRKAK
ncbi:MAG: type IV pilus assembly protein PilM [Candidatus Firestonebacteria bacterium]